MEAFYGSARGREALNLNHSAVSRYKKAAWAKLQIAGHQTGPQASNPVPVAVIYVNAAWASQKKFPLLSTLTPDGLPLQLPCGSPLLRHSSLRFPAEANSLMFVSEKSFRVVTSEDRILKSLRDP